MRMRTAALVVPVVAVGRAVARRARQRRRVAARAIASRRTPARSSPRCRRPRRRRAWSPAPSSGGQPLAKSRHVAAGWRRSRHRSSCALPWVAQPAAAAASARDQGCGSHSECHSMNGRLLTAKRLPDSRRLACARYLTVVAIGVLAVGCGDDTTSSSGATCRSPTTWPAAATRPPAPRTAPRSR